MAMASPTLLPPVAPPRTLKSTGTKLSRARESNLDRSVEDKIGWSFQRYIFKAVSIAFKANFEEIAALHLDLHRRSKVMQSRGNQGGRGHSCPASQRFPFHPAL